MSANLGDDRIPLGASASSSLSLKLLPPFFLATHMHVCAILGVCVYHWRHLGSVGTSFFVACCNLLGFDVSSLVFSPFCSPLFNRVYIICVRKLSVRVWVFVLCLLSDCSMYFSVEVRRNHILFSFKHISLFSSVSFCLLPTFA